MRPFRCKKDIAGEIPVTIGDSGDASTSPMSLDGLGVIASSQKSRRGAELGLGQETAQDVIPFVISRKP